MQLKALLVLASASICCLPQASAQLKKKKAVTPTVEKSRKADKALRDSLEKRLKPKGEYRDELYGKPLQGNLKKIDKKASGIRVESIQTILNVLGKTKDVHRKFELRRRLVDLFLEQGQYVEELEIRKYQANHKKWERTRKKTKAKEPELTHQKSIKIYKRAERVLRQIVKDSLEKKEVVYSLLDLGDLLAKKKNPEATKYFKLIVTKHKDSPLIAEAYLSLAEFYFEAANWKEALRWYQKLLKLRDSRYYPYAAYKLGWVYYNFPAKDKADQKRIFNKAATAFKLVIRYAQKSKKGTPLGDLRESAINDLVMVWADAQDVKAAYNYFKKIGTLEKYYIVLERMAAAFVKQGNTDNAIRIYEKLLKEAPLRPGNPAIVSSLIDQYEQKRKIKTVFDRLKFMVAAFLKPTSKWYQAQKGNKEVLSEAREKTEFTIRYWATNYHKAYEVQKRKPYLTFSSITYALYLKNLKTHKNAYEMRYYFADTLRSLGKHIQSGKQFFMVVNANKKDGKYLQDASESSVSEFYEGVKEKKFPAVPKPGTVPKPLPIPEEKKLLIESIDSHVKLFPKDKDVPYMKFEAADAFFAYGHYPAAVKRFSEIAANHPEKKQATAGVRIVLSYYSQNNNWLPLIDVTNKYLKIKKLPKKLLVFVRQTLIGASFKYASLLEKQKKHDEAARRFVKFYEDFPRDVNASKALYNAALNFQKDKNYSLFFKYGKELFDKYPKFEFVDELILTMAQTYEGIADYSNAARYYDLYSRRWPKKKTSLAAMYNASVLYAGLKFYEQASKIVSLMLRMYPNSQLTKTASTGLPKLYEESGDYAKAIALFEANLKRSGSRNSNQGLNTRATIIELKRKRDGGRVSKAELDRLVADLKKSKGGLEARKVSAKILFERIEPEFKKFGSLKIRGDENLEADAGRKNKALAALVQKYQRIVEIGHPEYIIASLIRMGTAHVEFGNSLLVTPVEMSGTDQEIIEQFAPIKQAGMQLVRDGMDFYKAANKNALDLRYVSNWTNKSRELLSEYFPLEFGRFSEPFLEFKYAHFR